MENVNEVVQVAEPVAEETVKSVSKMSRKGKTALIVAGSALAVAGGYFLVTKVIAPKFSKKNCKCEEAEKVEDAAPEEAEK